MSMEFHSGNAYIVFEKEIEHIKNAISSIIKPTLGYSSNAIKRRLVQQITEDCLGPYVTTLRKRFDNNKKILPKNGVWLNCKKFNLQIGTGKVKIPIFQKILSMISFYKLWTYNASLIIIGFIKYSKSSPATLIFGIGLESLFKDGDDSNFVRFCRSSNISPLMQGSKFIIQFPSNKGENTDKKFSYMRRPIHSLFKQTNLGTIKNLKLLYKHLLLLYHFQIAIIKVPLLSLIANELAYKTIVEIMDEEEYIEAIIFTNSNCTAQPLWMQANQNFKTHMVWYSQNHKPFTYLRNQLHADIPSSRQMVFDVHWVWTVGFKNYLKYLGLTSEINYVGPILWYLPHKHKIQTNDNNIVITIFDINPFSDEFALQFGEFENYNRPKHLLKFISDIIKLKDKLEKSFKKTVIFKLKQKRGYNKVYDKDYFEFLDDLSDKGIIKNIQYQENMFSLISESHVVIVFPYSSPAYAADYLKVPAIYYDPTKTLKPTYEETSYINFANTTEGLSCLVVDAINRSKKNNED
jgi:polysaccharide biosynthesis PFTS motif protein